MKTMAPEQTPRSHNIINQLFLFCSVLFFLALAYNHFQIVTYEMPLDAIEGAMPTVTATIAAGENPYSLENQPARASLYPVLYNIVVAPFTLVFGNTLELHRAINGIFILACCLLLSFAIKKSGGSSLDSFAGAMLFYAGLLFHSSPIASPNGIGLFLFLASIVVPWKFEFSSRSLFVALILGILAFYSKQYFLACLGYIGLYLFLAVSKKKAIFFGFSALFLLLASLAGVHYTSPYFIDNTVFSQMYASASIGSFQTALEQLSEYSLIFLPVLVILFILVLRLLFNPGTSIKSEQVAEAKDVNQKLVDLTELDAPLLYRTPDYFWLCFECSLVIIVFALGKNPANHLTYLFQLISPFLLVGIFSRTSRSVNFRWLYQLLTVVTFYSIYTTLTHDFSVDQKNWDRLTELVSESEEIYAPATLVTEILHNGGEIYQTNHTPYFAFAKLKPPYFAKDNSEETVAKVWEKYVERIYQKIENQEFDLIILDSFTHLPMPMTDLNRTSAGDDLVIALLKESFSNDTARLKKHYRRSEMITLSMDKRPAGGKFVMQIWKPRRTIARPDTTETFD